MASLRSLAPLAFALVLGMPAVSHAQSFSDAQKGEIQKIIKDYLVANPELLEEMSAELQKRQSAAEAEKHRAAVQKNADVIFNSPRGVVVGITTRARQSRRAADRATPCAWLPAEAQTTPRARSAGDRCAILL